MKDVLVEYGLSDKEADLYLAALKLGDCTANRLSEITNIRRSTVYEVVETLKKKGLINSFEKDKKIHFNASEPNSLIEILQDKQKMIENILPQLEKSKKTIIEKPKVELYEGKIGVKTALLDSLFCKEILVYGASATGDELFGAYIENFAKRRVENKILLRAIIEKDIPSHMLKKDVARFTKIKRLNMFKEHNVAYFIYGETILTIILEPQIIATKITSRELANSQRIIFEQLWKIAK